MNRYILCDVYSHVVFTNSLQMHRNVGYDSPISGSSRGLLASQLPCPGVSALCRPEATAPALTDGSLEQRDHRALLTVIPLTLGETAFIVMPDSDCLKEVFSRVILGHCNYTYAAVLTSIKMS